MLFLDFYFVRVYFLNYGAFGRAGKTYLSPESHEKSILKKGSNPVQHTAVV